MSATRLFMQRVEVTFVGEAPAASISRASGVRDVEVEGSTLRCNVLGSIQPFLEALRGHEVMTLASAVERSIIGGHVK